MVSSQRSMDLDNSCSSSGSHDSCENSKVKSPQFFPDFVCGHLAKHRDSQDLIEVYKWEGHCILHLKDIERLSYIYCEFKSNKGKKLDEKLKKRVDNFKQILKYFVNASSLKKVGAGIEYEKQYLKYEVLSDNLKQSLLENYNHDEESDMMPVHMVPELQEMFSFTDGASLQSVDEVPNNMPAEMTKRSSDDVKQTKDPHVREGNPRNIAENMTITENAATSANINGNLPENQPWLSTDEEEMLNNSCDDIQPQKENNPVASSEFSCELSSNAADPHVRQGNTRNDESVDIISESAAAIANIDCNQSGILTSVEAPSFLDDICHGDNQQFEHYPGSQRSLYSCEDVSSRFIDEVIASISESENLQQPQHLQSAVDNFISLVIIPDFSPLEVE